MNEEKPKVFNLSTMKPTVRKKEYTPEQKVLPDYTEARLDSDADVSGPAVSPLHEQSALQKQEARLRDYQKVFERREKAFDKRIKTEKWGNFSIGEVVNKIFELGKVLTGRVPYPYQEAPIKRLFLSVLLNDGEELVFEFSRQSGKTDAISFAISTICTVFPALAQFFPQIEHLKNGVKVGVYAGTHTQAENLKERVHQFMHSDQAKEVLEDPDLELEVDDDSWSNGSSVFYSSAATQTKIEAKTFDIAICEECQDIPDIKITKSIHPMLAARNGTLVKIGTPIPTICELYKALIRQRRKDLTRNKSRQCCYVVDYKEAQKHNIKYRKYIQHEKERIGEDSDSFRMSYGLEWILDKGMVITHDEFERKLEAPNLHLGNMNFDGIVVGGLDLAKEVNSTVFTAIGLRPVIMHRDGFRETVFEHQILDWMELQQKDWDEQLHHIKNFARKFSNMRALAFDQTGLGNVVYDLLKKHFRDAGIKPIGVNFSGKKGDLAEVFDQLLADNLLKVPASSASKKTRRWNKFYYQLIECERVFKNGEIRFQKPKDSGAMDDYVDSLLLAIYAARTKLRTPIMHQQVNVFHNSLKHVRDNKVVGFDNVRRLGRAKLAAQMAKSMSENRLASLAEPD